MNLSKVFAFDEAIVRVAGTPETPLFVAADVCRVLGIKQTANAVRRFTDTEKGVFQIHTLGGEQEMVVVTEKGLYRLIFRSDKRAARKFQDWVFGEVLPSIRKTGRYELDRTAQLWQAFALAKTGQVQRDILAALGISRTDGLGLPASKTKRKFNPIAHGLVFADLLAGLQAGKTGAETFRVNQINSEPKSYELFMSSRVLRALRLLNPDRYGVIDSRDLRWSLRLSKDWVPGTHVQRLGPLKEPCKVWLFKVTQEGPLLELCKHLSVVGIGQV